MLTPEQIQAQAERVVSAVGRLPAADALRVLNTATGQVLGRITDASDETPELAGPAVPMPVHLLHRQRGTPSKIEQDSELRDFIHGLSAELTLKGIAAACLERFGAERAPSKSAVHRYLQRLKHPTNKGEDT